MSATVTVRKNSTGQVWQIPAEHPLLGQVCALSRAWGITVEDVEKAAPPGAVVEVQKGGKPMKARELIKRAAEAGDVDRNRLYAAVQKRADKEVTGATGEIRFAKYCEQYPEVRAALDAAAPPAARVFKHSTEALSHARSEHLRKAGLDDAGGVRDEVDEHFISEADRTLRNVAIGLRDAASGPLKGAPLASIISHLRTSSAYGSLARSGKGYKAVIAAMLKDHLP